VNKPENIHEVLPGIFMFRERGGLSAIKPEVNIYILAGHDGLIFDAGYGSRGAVAGLARHVRLVGEYYKSQNRRFALTRVLPSHAHPDHFSGLRRIRDALGCRVLLTRNIAERIGSRESFYRHFEADAFEDYLVKRKPLGRVLDRLRLSAFRAVNEKIYGMEFLDDPDEIIPDESAVSINGEPWLVFPSPGHSSDHISLYSEKKGVLFAGDNVLRSITTWLGPPDSSLEDYLRSLERIRRLPELNTILSAHGSPVVNPRERVAEILEYRKKRTLEVLDETRKRGGRGITVDRLVRMFYPRENIFKREMARGWIVLTLKHLESRGYCTRGVNGTTVFFTAGEDAPRAEDLFSEIGRSDGRP